jgi:hypothetical protein
MLGKLDKVFAVVVAIMPLVDMVQVLEQLFGVII